MEVDKFDILGPLPDCSVVAFDIHVWIVKIICEMDGFRSGH